MPFSLTENLPFLALPVALITLKVCGPHIQVSCTNSCAHGSVSPLARCVVRPEGRCLTFQAIMACRCVFVWMWGLFDSFTKRNELAEMERPVRFAFPFLRLGSICLELPRHRIQPAPYSNSSQYPQRRVLHACSLASTRATVRSRLDYLFPLFARCSKMQITYDVLPPVAFLALVAAAVGAYMFYAGKQVRTWGCSSKVRPLMFCLYFCGFRAVPCGQRRLRGRWGWLSVNYCIDGILAIESGRDTPCFGRPSVCLACRVALRGRRQHLGLCRLGCLFEYDVIPYSSSCSACT